MSYAIITEIRKTEKSNRGSSSDTRNQQLRSLIADGSAQCFGELPNERIRVNMSVWFLRNREIQILDY
jgi:hypothetical protein